MVSVVAVMLCRSIETAEERGGGGKGTLGLGGVEVHEVPVGLHADYDDKMTCARAGGGYVARQSFCAQDGQRVLPRT